MSLTLAHVVIRSGSDGVPHCLVVLVQLGIKPFLEPPQENCVKLALVELGKEQLHVLAVKV